MLQIETSPSIRAADLLIPLSRYKLRVLLVMAVIMTIGISYWYTMPAKYDAHASLLALFRSDYGLRPNTGEAAVNGASFDNDQITGTEGRLINRIELFRRVIADIGIERIYPEVLQPRTGVRAKLHDAKQYLDGWLMQMGVPIAASPASDPLELAALNFAANFTVTVIKSSHVIDLTFSHRDPQIAADGLNLLIKTYLSERSTLYGDEQASIIVARLQELRKQLYKADQELAHYKAVSDIGAFASRREMLLQQQSALETNLHSSESSIGEQKARVADLQTQLATLPAYLVTQRDIDIEQRTQPQRVTMDAVAAKLALMKTTYAADSSIIKQLEAQLDQRQKEIIASIHNGQASITRTGQNPLWLAAHADLQKATEELQASIAKRASAQASVGTILVQLHLINQHEERLTQLERDRQTAEDDYRSVRKTYEDRRIVDIVDEQRKQAIRQIDLAKPPTIDASRRRLVMLASGLLAILVGIIVAFLSNYGRRAYLTAEEIEIDLGLAVLVSLPYQAAMPKLHVLPS